MPARPKTVPAAKRTCRARQCGIRPIIAVMATRTSEVVVACLGDWPAAYTRAGTARIDPPPPRAPSDTPIRKPKGEASRLRMSTQPP
jgi:hypothetical protein